MVRRPTVRFQPKSRRVGFELRQDDRWWVRGVTKVKYIIQSAIRTSTGSPSDGLGGEGSESTTSTSAFIAAQAQIIAETDGADWTVDEIIVKGDEVDALRYLGSSSGGSPLHSDRGSLQNESHAYSEDRPELKRNGRSESSTIAGILDVYKSFEKVVRHFFDQSFEDEEREVEFQKLNWYSTKPWAFYGSLYLVINWVLYLGLNLDSTKFTIYAQVCYYGGLTLLTFPLPFLIAYDIPVRHPVLFQLWFALAVWFCGITEIIGTKLCLFFESSAPRRTCNGKDFLMMMYYVTAQPALMMFVLSKRIYTLIMQIAAFVLLVTLILPVEPIFARNVVSYAIFSAFLQGLHYNRETTERRLFLLNSQLKSAYRSQQKAQMAQHKASLAKRRFASYIFHEVRVPLNNAAIAFHIMQESGAFDQEGMKSYFEQIDALDRSFLAMGQVLNDSLDLEKMDQGHFDIHPRPFPLHSIIRAALGPLIVSAQSRGLEIHIDLDERIDELCRLPLGTGANPFQLQEAEPEKEGGGDDNEKSTTAHREHANPKGPTQGTPELWVRGDEVRLHQVLTNLVSNAIKFTPENTKGGIRISSQFVTLARIPSGGKGWEDGLQHPYDREQADYEDGNNEEREMEEVREQGREKDPVDAMEKGEISPQDEEMASALNNLRRKLSNSPGLKRRTSSRSHGQKGDSAPMTQDMLVFRLEIADQGPGIKPSDLADNKLFQPFAQTKVGRMSKNGTGLGLAIVRQIVSLSGGRLGIRSHKGQGATFWVELSYPLATKSEIAKAMKSNTTPEPAFATFNHHAHRGHSPELSNSSQLSKAQPQQGFAAHLNLGRWPTVAFSEDVKPPMLLGRGVMGTPPLTPGSTRSEMREYGFMAGSTSSHSHSYSHDGGTSSTKGTPRDEIPMPSMIIPRPSMIQIESSRTESDRTLTEGASPRLMEPSLIPEDGVGPVPAPPPTSLSPALPSPASPALSPSMVMPSTLPSASESPGEVSSLASTPTAAPTKTKTKTVDPDPLIALVVDDDLVTRLQMVKLLQMNGCVVDVAKDGQECLDMILSPNAKYYDLVSMDNHMPVKTGEDAVKEIRLSGSDLFIVGCTGNALTEDQRSFIKAGVNYVLTKPINFALLRKYVQEARERRNDRRNEGASASAS
ncbi:hypothetical protein K435DRAFT_828505 [Dendrothele bispora CBS 962.96]|uniref:histidine kinase n=1 Tax=Dendrothele bispora (strain CBS 962.96) TaxID=1314807 RepID=A0A4S8M7B0_DENBC|nr:hypothetical protein K435DRAFT_828505 [Dendrothele bispora CBS 962.96]